MVEASGLKMLAVEDFDVAARTVSGIHVTPPLTFSCVYEIMLFWSRMAAHVITTATMYVKLQNSVYTPWPSLSCPRL